VVFPKNDVGLTYQRFVIFTKAKPTSPKGASEQPLMLRIGMTVPAFAN
jgi:hypothetical protein